MAEHNDLGKAGEELACEYLINKGFKILERNWRFGNDEIDIIAQHADNLIVVEVKTRMTNFFGEPQTFVSKQKQGFLIRAANVYSERIKQDLEVRFDIIGVVLSTGAAPIIEHIEEAFLPRW